MRPVVVFELNEVPWRIVDWWREQRPAGALAELVDAAACRTTVAADHGHLSPWITWPTVHRGVANDVHGIGHFGQDTAMADALAPPWWTVAADAGRRVGTFGLLHTSTLPADVDRYAFFVPDTFASAPDTHPRALEPFQAFNLAMARASARNVSTAIDTGSAARFVARAPALGLRPHTAARLASQLIGERRHPQRRVRRRSFQSVVGFDLFDRLVARTTPDAAAFFTNHVASAMHRYWAATFPDDYPAETFGFDEAWIRTWDGEIAHALDAADRMLARLARRARRSGATVIVASSMGQQASQGTPVGRQLYLRDLRALAAAAGVAPGAVQQRPAMDPDVSASVDPGARDALSAFLGDLAVGGNPVPWSLDDGFLSMTFGQADDAIGDVTVAGRTVEPSEIGLEVIEIEDEAASTGYHVPEGILLLAGPGAPPAGASAATRPVVSTTAIAPWLLDRLEVDRPDHLAAADAGTIDRP